MKKIDAPVDTQNIEASHRLKSDDNGRNNQGIVKFSKHEDMFRPMNKNGPWEMLPEMAQVSSKYFIV